MRYRLLSSAGVVLLPLLACSSSGSSARGSDTAVDTGGSGGGGGVTAPSNDAAVGGGTGSGGMAATGAAGGAMASTGGAAGRDGTSITTSPAGGSSGAAGAARTGGATATGGVTASGGVALTGGNRAAGGTIATGGVRDGGLPDGRAGAGGTTGLPDAAATGGATSKPGTGAPETKPLGYGQGTTGGGAAAPVEVGSMAALQAAIDAYAGSGGLSLRYTGTFDFATIPDPCTQWNLPAQIVEIKKKSDITLVGADGSAANFGIHIASSSSNIIIRNMTMGLLPGGGDSDAINIEGMSGGIPTNIWLDHNTLFSSMTSCAGAGDTSFDGLIDLKKGADNVTVSYNYVHDHQKVSLNGFSDSDTAVRHITFHHNIFENVGSRTPLQRGGYSHVLNNLMLKVSTSGINVRMDGYALVEGNYFANVKNPVTSRDSDAIGYWDLRGNNLTSPSDFAAFGITWAASDSTPTKDATDWTTTAVFPVALGYSYTVDPPSCLNDGLHAVAGAGKGLATLACR